MRVSNLTTLGIVLVLLTLLWTPAVLAETLTNADVVKLVDSGLGSKTIALTVNSAESTNFDTSANGLAALAKAGVSDNVIQSMIRRSSSATARATPAIAIRPLKTVRRNIQPPAITPETGGSYYTRYNLWYERKRHSTTNYSRGSLLPVNSKVTLVAIEGKKIVLELESGALVNIALAQKTTLRPLTEIASELLSNGQIPLSRLGDELEKTILAGTMRLGMTKEQVLMTRGYPPRHKTPSLDGDTWIYWSSRFVHRTLVFQDGVLTRGRSIN